MTAMARTTEEEAIHKRVSAKTVTMVEAKTRLAEWVRSAESGDPVVITRHGKAVVALVSADELERLAALRAAGPGAGLVSVAGGWDGSEELVAHLAEHQRSAARTAPDLD